MYYLHFRDGSYWTKRDNLDQAIKMCDKANLPTSVSTVYKGEDGQERFKAVYVYIPEWYKGNLEGWKIHKAIEELSNV